MAFGAQFAAFSQGPLAREKSIFINQYFITNLLFLSLIFAPLGVYLLWQLTGWETMFLVGEKNNIAGIFPTLFTSSNVLFGIIGYWITALSIKRKPRGDHHWVWCHCYNAFKQESIFLIRSFVFEALFP